MRPHYLVDNLAIYIPIWLDLLSLKEYKNFLRPLDLHSNMVRFIMIMPTATKVKSIEFTFQYG